jgi:hypothetical protein
MAEDKTGAGNRADQPGGIISQASQRDNAPGTAVVHTVQAGETLAGMNALDDPNSVQAGQELLVPAAPQGD